LVLNILCVTYTFVTSITVLDPRPCDIGHKVQLMSALPTSRISCLRILWNPLL